MQKILIEKIMLNSKYIFTSKPKKSAISLDLNEFYSLAIASDRVNKLNEY